MDQSTKSVLIYVELRRVSAQWVMVHSIMFYMRTVLGQQMNDIRGELLLKYNLRGLPNATFHFSGSMVGKWSLR